jgi:dephospho-CoA kinase
LPGTSAHSIEGVLQKDGSLDRARLRELVFAESRRKAVVEGLTHPAIRALTDARCERPPAVRDRRDSAAGGNAGAQRFDRVLVVDCEPRCRLARLQARDG